MDRYHIEFKNETTHEILSGMMKEPGNSTNPVFGYFVFYRNNEIVLIVNPAELNHIRIINNKIE